MTSSHRVCPEMNLAVWVTAVDRKSFQAELFHFGNQSRPTSAELRLLSPGHYHAELLSEGRPIGIPVPPFEFKQPLATIDFLLRPQTLCTLKVWHDAPRRE